MRDLDAPAAAAGEPRLEPQPADRPPAARRVGEQALDQQLERALELLARGGLGQLEPALELLVRAARAQRLVVAARQPQRPQPGLAEAVGDGRGGQRRELAQGPHAEPLERVDAGDLLPAPRARPASAADRRRLAQRPRSERTGRPASSRARRRSETIERRAPGAHPRRRRVGAEPVRARRRAAPAAPSARRARASTASGRPQSARSGSAAKNASPGREGSTAAPIASSARSDRSQAASARTGSGGTRTSAGQRESASPSRIPARTPNASAAPDASPITCGPPGSGASATGLPSSSRRSPSALREREAGDEGADGDHESNTCSYSAQDCQAGFAAMRQNLTVMRPVRLTSLAVVALAAIALGACGEKAEPEIGARPEATAAIPGGADPGRRRGDRRLGADAQQRRHRGAAPSTSRSRAWPRTGRTLIGSSDLDDARLQRLAALRRDPDEGGRARASSSIATFRLTERPGPGTCGAGTGPQAQTAFVIEDGKIAEWRRVGIDGAAGAEPGRPERRDYVSQSASQISDGAPILIGMHCRGRRGARFVFPERGEFMSRIKLVLFALCRGRLVVRDRRLWRRLDDSASGSGAVVERRRSI